MTVKSEVSRVSYTGDGSTTLFPVPFYFIAATDLRVLTRSATGTETPLTMTDYSVMGAGVETGGSVVLSVAPSVGTKLIIYRDPPLTQTADYVEGGRFPATSHERTLDRIVMMVQRISDMCMRGLKLGETDAPGSGRYRAGGNRISELADPVNGDDAVNKGYFDTHAGSAEAFAMGYADAAGTSATAAAASATAASGYATSSAVSATTAVTSAAAAAVSATNAAAIAGFDANLFLLKSGNLAGLASTTTARANLGLAAVAASGSYNDLADKPAAITVTYASLSDKPILATVATSGSYNDLTSRPTLGNAASRSVGTVLGTVAAGDDARFDQSSKAPLTSPAFIGVPTAPTAATSTNNQQIATTAFVKSAVVASTPTYGSVGSYILADFNTAAGGLNAGDTTPGSALSPTQSGTWRLMGPSMITSGGVFTTLFYRVS